MSLLELSSTAVIAPSVVNSVGDITLFIQLIFGLPRALDPAIIPFNDILFQRHILSDGMSEVL